MRIFGYSISIWLFSSFEWLFIFSRFCIANIDWVWFILLSLLILSISKIDHIIKTLITLCVLVISPYVLSSWFTNTYVRQAKLAIFKNTIARHIYPSILLLIIGELALMFKTSVKQKQIQILSVLVGIILFVCVRMYCIFTLPIHYLIKSLRYDIFCIVLKLFYYWHPIVRPFPWQSILYWQKRIDRVLGSIWKEAIYYPER